MAYRAYCFRTGRVTALLDDEEWAELEPFARNVIKGVQDYRRQTGASMDEALQLNPNGKAALDKYRELTGEDVNHTNDLWVVRLSRYGRHCPKCQKPFRTPNAKMCAECGYQLPEGEVAGPLVPLENEHAS